MLGGGQSVPLRPTQNLGDLPDKAAAREYLGVKIGTDVQAYDADLAAIAANSTNGLLARTGAGTAAARTITGTSNQVTVSNGDGVSGNPTLSLPQSIHTGASPTFTGLDLTGLTDNTLVRIGTSGLADSSIRETTSYPSLSATVGLVARVPSNGIAATPVMNDVLKLGGTSHTATLTGKEPAIAGFNHYGGSFGGGWIVRTRIDASDTQIDNTKFCANGGLELVHCSADPTGVAGKSQIWPRNSDGEWYARTGTGAAYKLNPRLTQAASQTSSFNVSAGNEYPIDLSGGTDITATFPGSPSEGDPFAIRIVTTHPTAKLVCSRNSLTIDGGTVENYYNLRQVGERLEFVYRNSTWLLVGDGRKPCHSQADQTTTQAISHDTPTMLTLESTVFDTGSIVSLAGDNLVPYRGAIWKVVGRTSLGALADQTRQITYLYLNGSASQIMQAQTTSSARDPYVVGACLAVVAPGDSVRLGVQWDVSAGTGTKSTVVLNALTRPFIAITECLRRN